MPKYRISSSRVMPDVLMDSMISSASCNNPALVSRSAFLIMAAVFHCLLSVSMPSRIQTSMYFMAESVQNTMYSSLSWDAWKYRSIRSVARIYLCVRSDMFRFF